MKLFIGGLIALILSVRVGAEPLLEGQVRLSSGQPAVGVQVRLFDLTDLRRFVGTTTDETGHFALSLQAFSTDKGTALPTSFSLGQNYPNPFNPSTIIPYQIPVSTHVRLEVFNLLGQRLATLVDAERSAGTHTAQWDGTDVAGRAMGAGVYIYRLSGGGMTESRRMVLVDGQAGVVAGVAPAPAAVTSSTDAAARKYGLAVAGAGVATYIDVDFWAGMVPMELVVEAIEPRSRGKVLTGDILGDVNGDGQVDLADALAVALYIIDSSITPPNNGDIALGDVNADGQFTTADVLLIATYSANPSDPSLPAGLGQSITDSLDVADRSTDLDAADYPTWNLPEGAVARLGKGTAEAVAFSSDGQVLAVAGNLGIWLYDVATSRELALLAGLGHTEGVGSISFSPDGSLLVSGDGDGKVIFWDISSQTQLATLQGHTEGVNSVSFSSDGSLLASGGEDGKVIVWHVSSRTQIVPLPHTEGVNSVSFSPDDSLLASGGEDGVIVWDVSSQTQIVPLPHTEGVSSVSFSPDGSLLASGGEDGVIVWDVSSRTRVATLYDGFSPVSFSPNSSVLAFGGEDGVIVWDVSSRTRVATLPHTGWTGSVSFSPDGSLLASEGWDGVIVWDVSSQTQLSILPDGDGVGSVSFSPDGSLLASGERDPWGGNPWYEDGDVILWDVSSRSQLAILQGHTSRVRSISFSPDGSLLASGGKDGDVIVWDVSSGSQVATLPHTSEVFSVSFSPDGLLLASGGGNPWEDGDVIVWDVSGRSRIATLPHTSEVFSVSFSPDGSLLASGGEDGVILWDVSGRSQVATLPHTGWIGSVSFSPDGLLLASGGGAGDVILWDVSGRSQVATLPHTSEVFSVSFSPDGSLLASGGWDGDVVLWDVSSGSQVATLPHTSEVFSVSFSPDGSLLASGERAGAILLWRLSSIAP